MKCEACDRVFTCGIDDPAGCWCSQGFPALLPVPEAGSGCYCPDCLKERIERTLAGAPPLSGADRAKPRSR